MVIQSSAIVMSGTSSLYKEQVREESLKAWTGSERPDFEGRKLPPGQMLNLQKDMVELSDQAKAMQAKGMETPGVACAEETSTFEISDVDKQNYCLCKRCSKP